MWTFTFQKGFTVCACFEDSFQLYVVIENSVRDTSLKIFTTRFMFSTKIKANYQFKKRKTF